jgi:hypothetical protein
MISRPAFLSVTNANEPGKRNSAPEFEQPNPAQRPSIGRREDDKIRLCLPKKSVHVDHGCAKTVGAPVDLVDPTVVAENFIGI